MGFTEHAWKAAAEAYGAARAEKYGKIHKLVVALQVVMIFIFAFGMVYLWKVGH